MQTLRTLVAGTDFSACAERALELAVTLAVATGARVTFVHVGDDLDDKHLLQSGEALSEVVARHRRCGAAVSGVLRSGKPWEKLDNVAAEVGASLIVIGRHGAGRGHSIELGSIAHNLVRCASRPVLTVACDFDFEGLTITPLDRNNETS